MEQTIQAKNQFRDFDLSPEIQRAIDDMGFEEATAIQADSIPLILSGADVIGHSQTGTGKTAAFGLPAIEKIDLKNRNVQVLVLCPTRELAMQACDEFRKFAKYKEGVKVVPIFGGQQIDRQIRLLRQGAQIVIGTPGRIMDHMRRNTLKFNNLQMIVLDEADEMLNMGFREDIEIILKDIPEERQTVLFSATMPPAIMSIVNRYQRDPKMIKVAHQQLTVPSIEQYYYEVPRGKKSDVLCRLLDTYNPSRSIVFCNTKRQVDELVSDLQLNGFMATGLHGDMKQTSRTQVMHEFKSGRTDILIATDVAARGIDVEDVEAVFNYDLPQDEEYYVHRIGRTGRAGKKGKAYSFVMGRAQVFALRDIQRHTGAKIELKAIPSVNEVLENKIQKFTAKVKEELEKARFERYVSVVDDLTSDEYTSVDIAAALISMSMGEVEVKQEIVAQKFDTGFPESDRSKPRFSSEHGMARLKIDIGRLQKVSANHILGAIAGETGLPGKAIGKIKLEDKFSYIDIPLEHLSMVLDAMKGCKIRGIKTTTVHMKKRD